ncbi:MAG: hypothetical protein HQK81_13775 [Desulfovibrionaceae bacterium]|nr:hypothetical protein [Desulfovibrionaceae bacterium]MBF0515113.1 hypothetical protein [Desulfovibrionaceae bacterium]
MKEAYHREMQSKIDELEKQMEEIKAKIKISGDDAHRKDYESHLAEFQAQKDVLTNKLHEMNAAHEDDWHAHKKDAEGIYGNLARYIGKVYAKYTGSGGTGMF